MAKLELFAGLCVLVSLLRPSWSESFLEERKRENLILQGLLRDYDDRIRPPSPDLDRNPVKVTINVFIRNVLKLDDVKGEMEVQLTFRQSWIDPRLRFSQEASQVGFIHVGNPSALWRPDTFFSNEVDGWLHTIPEPNWMMRLYPNGTILYSMRMFLRLFCGMDLRRFPHDWQKCPVIMASYGYMTSDVQNVWKDVEPVSISKNVQLKLFTLDHFETKNCTSKVTTGTYSCLYVDLVFRRILSSYVRGYYIPSIVLVILAWLTFWLHHQAAFVGRAIMASTALLAMMLLCADVHRSSVLTGYSKPIDTWTGVCTTFIFASIAELVMVQWLAGQWPSSRTTQDTDSNKELLEATTEGAGQFSMQPISDPGTVAAHSAAPMRQPFWKRWWGALLSYPPPERVDVLHRIGYPIVFALFQLCYWATYLP